MTVLSAVQSAALRIGVERPTVLYGGTSRELYELADLANACARMIAFDAGHDWTRLKTLCTLTGDGSSLSFDLPADYRRMLKDARLWPSDAPNSPLVHVIDTDTWLASQVRDFSGVTGMWTIIGDQIEVRSGGATAALDSGVTVKFYYITDRICANGGDVAQADFMADDDTFRLDERMLTLAMVYKWKEQKGLDYAEDMSNYENALFERIGADKGSRNIVIGVRRVPYAAEVAFPYTVSG